MKKATRWGAAIGVICGAEVIIAALIGGAGLAAILRPTNVGVVGLVLAVLLGGVVARRRRRTADRSRIDSENGAIPVDVSGRGRTES